MAEIGIMRRVMIVTLLGEDETSVYPMNRLLDDNVYGLKQEDTYDKDEEDSNLDDLNCWRVQVIDNNATPQGYICVIMERQ